MSVLASQSVWLVTGSHLYTGQVMYLNYLDQEQSHWVYNIQEAQALTKEQLTHALDHAKIDHQHNRVIDPYQIQLDPSSHLPVKKREQMRIKGPSIRRDLPPFSPPTVMQ